MHRKRKSKASAQPKHSAPPKPSAQPKTSAQEVTNSASNASSRILNVCRLCEAENGPFLDILDEGKRKIEELMPFKITDDDDLPRKMCFRCSAKLEELYEFVQKCTKTQDNLNSSLGKEQPRITKTKTQRTLWEEQLNKSNITNEVICDALIKKAMGDIADLTEETQTPTDDSHLPCKLSTNNETTVTKPTSEHNHISENQNEIQLKTNEPKKTVKEKDDTVKHDTDDEVVVIDLDDSKNDTPLPKELSDRVSSFQVPGFGRLFQCHMCNRNFLEKSSILNHKCLKLLTVTKPIEIPKTPNVKYINTSNKNFGHEQTNVVTSTLSNTKKRIGPASKINTNRNGNTSETNIDCSMIPNVVEPFNLGDRSDTCKKGNTSRKRSAPNNDQGQSQMAHMTMFGAGISSNDQGQSQMAHMTMFGAGISRSQDNSITPEANQPYPVGLSISQFKDNLPNKQDPVIFSVSALNKKLNESLLQRYAAAASYVLPVDTSQELTSQRGGQSYYGGQNYECQICYVKFGTEKMLLNHLKNHYNNMYDKNESTEVSRKRISKRTRK